MPQIQIAGFTRGFYDESTMKPGAIPENEKERLERLRSYEILDTLDEKEYDDIAALVSEICGTPMATISFVDEDRQWFKAAVGLEDRQTSRDVAFCGHTILGDQLFTVEDALQDERFFDNPLVTEQPGIRFYAGMPLVTPGGYRLGALCAIDSSPRQLTETQQTALEVLSRHVVTLLELRRRNRELQALSDLQTRLLAIIGHDLRSPLGNLWSAVSLLQNDTLSREEQSTVFGDLEQTLQSTESLVDNLVSWAKRNMNSAVTGEQEEIDLSELGQDLLNNLRPDAARKQNQLTLEVHELPPVKSDRSILEFILRNALGNANKFTEKGRILLSGRVAEHGLTLTVSDTGIGMAQDQVDRLFDWGRRSRSSGTQGEKGSGLALLLSRDMADRIGATIQVESEPGRGTRFMLSLPTR